MTKQFWVYFFVSLTFLFLASCKQSEKIKPPKVGLQNSDSCHCSEIEPLPPPPPENFVISTDTIFYKEHNVSRPFTVSLIADKTVYIEREPLQLFHIKASNYKGKDSYNFALPTKYNKYWSNFHIYKNTEKKIFNIGFKNTDSNFIHSMYSVYLDTFSYREGYIRIDFKEQITKSLDETN